MSAACWDGLLVAPLVFRAPSGLTCRAGLLCGARPLCVPVGGGPPARSPHASLRLGVVDLEARPGPAATHRHRGRALRSLRRPPHLWGRVTVRQLYASSRCLARSRHRPRAPQPGPPVPPGPSNPSNRPVLGRESPKTQTTSVKMREFGVFWARWSVFWAHGGYE